MDEERRSMVLMFSTMFKLQKMQHPIRERLQTFRRISYSENKGLKLMLEENIDEQMKQFHQELAARYRHERDYWKDKAVLQESRALIFKGCFAISIFLNLVGWLQ